MFIKKIFEDKLDDSVHEQFVRFSKGTFEKRAVINVKKGKDSIKVTTSFELANDLVAFICRLAKFFRVQGIILNKEQIEGLEAKKKAGLYSYNIAKELSSEELNEFASTAYTTLLDCSSPEGKIDLKIKKKLPKPGKNKAKVNDKFCQLTLDLSYWADVKSEFLWDMPDEIKKAHIEHSYIIEDIVIPAETESKDFEQIRKEAKRKGKLIRKAEIDGKEIVSEKALLV